MDFDNELDALLGLSGDLLGFGGGATLGLPTVGNPGLSSTEVGDPPVLGVGEHGVEEHPVEDGQVAAPTESGMAEGRVGPGTHVRKRGKYFREYRERRKRGESSLVSRLRKDIVALKKSNSILLAEKELLELKLEEFKIREKGDEARRRLEALLSGAATPSENQIGSGAARQRP